jgi:gamma-glutamyl-gamma-aminobutyrate hydrolase PuuD
VSARAADGTIEAIEPIEFDQHPLLAVQWHPEKIPNEPHSKQLFDWLIDQAIAGRPHVSSGQKLNRLSPFF